VTKLIDILDPKYGTNVGLELNGVRIGLNEPLINWVVQLENEATFSIVVEKADMNRETEFNVIVPPQDTIYSELKINCKGTIRDAQKMIHDYLDPRKTYLVEDVNENILDKDSCIEKLRAPRDLFFRESVQYFVELKYGDCQEKIIELRSGKVHTVGELRRYVEGILCNCDGTVCRDNMILRSNYRLIAVQKDNVKIIKVVLVDGTEVTYEIYEEVQVSDFRRVIEKDHCSGIKLLNGSSGESIDENKRIKEAGGYFRCEELSNIILEDEVRKNEESREIGFDLDGRHFTVRVPKGETVEYACRLISRYWKVNSDDVSIIFRGRTLPEGMAINRLPDCEDNAFGVHIRMDNQLLVQSVIGIRSSFMQSRSPLP
jgi:hypothetical protein